MPPPNEPSKLLRHIRPDCAGSWQLTQITRVWFWRCAGCRALHLDEPWVREAASLEFDLGERLGELAQDGWRLLWNEGPA